MANTGTQPIDEVLEQIYRAALEPAAWQSAIERMAELVGARAAMLFVMDWTSGGAASVAVCHRIDPALILQWQADYVPHDLWSQAMRGLPPGCVASGASVVEPHDLHRSLIYNDVLAKAGWTDVVVASLARIAGLELPISFYGSDGLFQRSQMRLLERLAPHLRLAVRLQNQMAGLEQRATAVEAIVDRLIVGVVTLAPSGKVVWLNRRAESILDSRDGVSLVHGRLRCARTGEDRLLHAAIAAAAAAGDRVAIGQGMAVSRPSGLRPFGLVVAPLLASEAILGMHQHTQASVVVTMSDPEVQADLLPERVARLFGLTPAESRLAVALAMELTLADFANEAGITIGTARWTLSRVLEKTGCRRQSELVRLVLGSAAGVVGQ